MAPASEPAPASVRQKAARFGPSVWGGSNSAFELITSGDEEGRQAEGVPPRVQATPPHAAAISSVKRHPSSVPRPAPPYSSGTA